MSSSRNGFSRLWLIPAASIGISIIVIGLWIRWARAETLDERVSERALPTVAVVSPEPVDGSDVSLPARLEAWAEAPIYARVSGYVRSWSADIGQSVKAGQVLAQIDAPDVDQSLGQARAEWARARSDAALATTTARRWQELSAGQLVSQQETDQRVADQRAQQSAANALAANVNRLAAMQGFSRLLAPFDGVVTQRNTDVGALIDEGSAQSRPLFVVSDVERLRVYVSVPQRQLGGIAIGSVAQLTVPEQPGKVFEATVQSMAQAVDPQTGGMRVQLAVDNADHQLLAGGFATVRFPANRDSGSLGVPPSALIVNRSGPQIALLGAGNKVTLRAVTIAADHGNVIELAEGVQARDRVISNPPDGLVDGAEVRIAQAPE